MLLVLRSANAPLGLTSQELNQKVQNTTLKIVRNALLNLVGLFDDDYCKLAKSSGQGIARETQRTHPRRQPRC